MNGITIKVVDGKIEVTSIADTKELNMTDDEKKLAEIIIAVLIENGINQDQLEVVAKSNDYITIVHHGCEWESDIARFKFTPRAKWVAVSVPESKRDALIDDPLFAAQKNKRQAMWKSKITKIEDATPLAQIASEELLEMQARFPECR